VSGNQDEAFHEPSRSAVDGDRLGNRGAVGARGNGPSAADTIDTSPRWTISDTLSWTAGKHSYKFGASFIKGLLAERIIAKGALNIHMGISPYYRGSSCNFWALYDGNPDLVGATIHLISKGLDSGGMLYHARPKSEPMDPFVLGMRAVEAAQDSLVDRIASGAIKGFAPVAQNKAEEIRYSRNAEFTDAVAAEYLARGLTAEKIGAQLKASAPRQFLNLFQPTR